MRWRPVQALGSLWLLSACDAEPDEPDVELPELQVCDAVRDWPSERATLERQVVAAINDRRGLGSDCGERGKHGSGPALAVSGALRCAARLHALDMSTQAYVDHEDPDGVGATDRAEQVEYAFDELGEAVAGADVTPAELVDSIWRALPGSCWALMHPGFEDAGVGYVEPLSADSPYGGYWVAVTGLPKP